MHTVLIQSKERLKFLANYNVYGDTYILPKEKDQFDTCEFNGSGIFDDKFVTSREDFDNTVDVGYDKERLESIQMDMSGALCAFVRNGEDETFIIPDPLGTAILFYYDAPNLKIFSNAIQEILDVLEKLDIYPEKNVEFMLESMATSNAGLIETPFKDIHVLKPFQYVEAKGSEVFIHTNSQREVLIRETRNTTPEAVLKVVQEDIANNIKRVDEYPTYGNRICHLTGGFDSRLVLSALISQGLQNRYVYYCSGRFGTPDKDISIELSRHYGLVQTNFSGHFQTEAPSSFENKILWEMDYSNGMGLNVHSHYKKEDNLILGGAYGGLVRSYFSQLPEFDEFESYESLALKMWPNLSNDNGKGVFKGRFKNRFVEKFHALMREANEIGIPEKSLVDYYYLRIRNRYHFGTYIFNQNDFNPRFDPIYSAKGALMALNLDKKTRSSNLIGIELMRNFHEELIQLPFDKPKISKGYVEMRGDIEKKTFQHNYSPVHNNRELKSFKEAKSSITASKEDVERANKMKAHVWQVAEMQNVKNGLKRIIDNIDEDTKNDLLNMKYINQLINKEITNRVDLRNLHNIYSSLLWYDEN